MPRLTKTERIARDGLMKNLIQLDREAWISARLAEAVPEAWHTLEADLDAWLVHYNTERPHLGYRNMGRRPIETVMSFVSQEGKVEMLTLTSHARLTSQTSCT